MISSSEADYNTWSEVGSEEKNFTKKLNDEFDVSSVNSSVMADFDDPVSEYDAHVDYVTDKGLEYLDQVIPDLENEKYFGKRAKQMVQSCFSYVTKTSLSLIAINRVCDENLCLGIDIINLLDWMSLNVEDTEEEIVYILIDNESGSQKILASIIGKDVLEQNFQRSQDIVQVEKSWIQRKQNEIILSKIFKEYLDRLSSLQKKYGVEKGAKIGNRWSKANGVTNVPIASKMKAPRNKARRERFMKEKMRNRSPEGNYHQTGSLVSANTASVEQVSETTDQSSSWGEATMKQSSYIALDIPDPPSDIYMQSVEDFKSLESNDDGDNIESQWEAKVSAVENDSQNNFDTIKTKENDNIFNVDLMNDDQEEIKADVEEGARSNVAAPKMTEIFYVSGLTMLAIGFVLSSIITIASLSAAGIIKWQKNVQ